jgi:hypothetical protein
LGLLVFRSRGALRFDDLEPSAMEGDCEASAMPPWRETATATLPELADEIAEAENPYLLWIELRRRFEDAYDDLPPNESLISRIYAFSEWCQRAPRGRTAEDDLLTCVSVCFLEHIPEHPAARADMPRWFTRERLFGNKEIFSYMIGEQGFDALTRLPGWSGPADGHARSPDR